MHLTLTSDDLKIHDPQSQANRRLLSGLLVSLILHALILSLQLGVPGIGLPDFELPWRTKRTGVLHEPLKVNIQGVQGHSANVPVVPETTVTVSELFKLPEPILPAPASKTSTSPGIVLEAPTPSSASVKAQRNQQTPKKRGTKPTVVPQLPTLPPPRDTGPDVITQDQVLTEFVLPKQEKKEQQALTKIENTVQEAEVSSTLLQDAEAEQKRLEEQRMAALAQIRAMEVQEALKKKAMEEARLSEEKRLAEMEQRRLQDELLEKQKKQLDSLLTSSINQMNASHVKPVETANDDLKRLKQTAQQQALAALQKREQEQMREEALREAQRQELISQETRKQEELRRQAERHQQQMLAMEESQKKQLQQQMAQIQLKQWEEEKQKQRALLEQSRQQEIRAQRVQAQQLLEKRLEEQKLAEQKLAEQKLAEQKLAEQKLAEQNLAEQKLAEQKLAEQKLAEQKLAEQKLAEQKLAEQRLAEQRLVEQRLAEQRLAEQRLAEQRKAQELAEAQARAHAQAQVAKPSGLNGSLTGNGATPKSDQTVATTGDFASRLREQAKRSDIYKDSLGAGSEMQARRRSFLGAYEKEVPLRMYVDSLKQKLERNGNLIAERRSLSDVEHQVWITMVIRRDGTIDDLTITKSSGSRSIDQRASNIAKTNAPFAAFPPALALKYDVIEFQALWVFGDRLRILDHVPGTF